MGHGGPRGFRVWNKEANEYWSESYLMDSAGCLYEMGILADHSTLFFSKQDRYVIEMASGFKSDDGEPVYAGDVVVVPPLIGESDDGDELATVGVVKFVNGAWVVGTKHGCTRLWPENTIKLIGNIHHLDELPKKHQKLFSPDTYIA